jgi:hypothetical protein
MGYSSVHGRSLKRLTPVQLEPFFVLEVCLGIWINGSLSGLSFIHLPRFAFVYRSRQLAEGAVMRLSRAVQTLGANRSAIISESSSESTRSSVAHPATNPDSLAVPSAASAPPAIPPSVLQISPLEAVGYGLYAIIVHSGESANSGHYYAFCRRSGSSNGRADLSQPDCVEAPWVKFNDSSVTESSWTDLTRSIDTSTSDTAYVLFYKRLSGAAAEEAVRRWRSSGNVAVGTTASLEDIGVSDAVRIAMSDAERELATLGPGALAPELLSAAAPASDSGTCAATGVLRESGTPVTTATEALAALEVNDAAGVVVPAAGDSCAVPAPTQLSLAAAKSAPSVSFPLWASRVHSDNVRLVAAEVLQRGAHCQADFEARLRACLPKVVEEASQAAGIDERSTA